MKSLIRDNPLGIALLATAAILLLLVLLLPFLSGGIPDDDTVQIAAIDSTLSEQLQISKLEPIEEFEVIKQRPLFNDDRKAIEMLADEGDADTELLVEIDDDRPLNADLTGVIITKDQRIAMLLDHGSKTTISAAEGESLDGELSGWSVEKVEARNVSLKNQQGEITELELLMFTKSLGNVAEKPTRAGRQDSKKAGSKAPPGDRADAKKADERKNKDDKAGQPAPKPMTAAEFMRQGLEKRRAAQKKKESEKNSGSSDNDG